MTHPTCLDRSHDCLRDLEVTVRGVPTDFGAAVVDALRSRGARVRVLEGSTGVAVASSGPRREVGPWEALARMT